VPLLHNAGERWPGKGFLKQPGVLKVVIGPAIDSEGKSAAELHNASTEWVEANYGRISD
jgi:1-acyl-sn-glycerol-3-phosphate acyltransferase